MRYFLLTLAIMVVLVAGCQDETQNNSEAGTNQEENTETEQEDTENTQDNQETEDEQNQDSEETEQENRNEERYGRLQEVGETADDNNGKVELTSVNRLDEVIEQGPIKIDMINAKVLKWSDLNQQSLNYFQSMLNTDQETFHYIQLRFHVTNNSDQDVSWTGLDTIVADEQQIDARAEDFVGDLIGPTVYAGTETRYAGGFMLNNKEVDSLRLIFSRVSEEGSYDTIEDQMEYNIEF